MSGKKGQIKTGKTRENYEKLLHSYRNQAENHAAAARTIGCGYKMAMYCFEKGWPTPDGSMPPICQKIAEETRAAQAQAEQRIRAHQTALIEEAEQAKARGIEAKTEEEAIVRTGRKEVLQAFGMALDMVPAMRKLAKGVNAAIMDGSYKVDPASAFKLMKEFTNIMQKGLMGAELTIRLSRLDRGQPTAIVEELMNWTPEECEREIEEAAAALKRAKDRGLVGPKPGDIVVHVEPDEV